MLLKQNCVWKQQTFVSSEDGCCEKGSQFLPVYESGSLKCIVGCLESAWPLAKFFPANKTNFLFLRWKHDLFIPTIVPKLMFDVTMGLLTLRARQNIVPSFLPWLSWTLIACVLSPPSLNKINNKIKWKTVFGGEWRAVLRLTQLKK